MEAFQKPSQRRGLGWAIAQTTFQAVILSQKADVVGTFAADGLEQDDRFDELSLQEAALTFAQAEIGSDQIGQTQRTVSAGNAQQAGMRASGFLQRPLVQDKGRLVQQGQASSHRLTYR